VRQSIQPDNEKIAAILDEVAEVLAQLPNNPFRIHSYRVAAETVRNAEESVAELADRTGEEGLRQLPGVGTRLARSIREIAETGRLRRLEQLKAAIRPEDVLAQVPGIGDELAAKIHTELGIDTLEELEVAAFDGRLEQLPGIGPKRLQGVRDTLAGRFGRSASRRQKKRLAEVWEAPSEPPIELLFQIDARYREKAEAGQLRTIAPRRVNPQGEAWLPVMGVRRSGWRFRVLFSNTPQAHQLGKTRDWVVIYFEREGYQGQRTVVTAQTGPLKDKRIVRGREGECLEFYAGHDAMA
jgi:Holliday junction resolvasome RuvABC DNA-binding subunit